MRQQGHSPFLRVAHQTAIALAATLAAAAVSAAAAGPSGTFAAVLGGVYNGSGDTIFEAGPIASATAPVVVEFGDAATAYGKFRAALGANGYAASGVGGIDREVDGGSLWSDGFTVSGGSGSGLLPISVQISGTLTGLGQMNFALFVSDRPYNLGDVIATVGANQAGFWALQMPNSTREMYTAVANGCGTGIWNQECGHAPIQNYSGPVDITLTASVPFNYGQTFYVLGGFSGAVLTPGGSASFLNSADFGISAPAGASVASLSGVAYAAAVPEPASALMLALGIAALAATERRRSARRQQHPG